MSRAVNPADEVIIKLLQNQGLIKSEAEARLKDEVYRLHPHEIEKVKTTISTLASTPKRN